MGTKFIRESYKILNDKEQEEYFNDEKFQTFYNQCLKNKDKFIKLVKEISYIRKSIPYFNNVTANGIVSIFLDALCARAFGGEYVDKIGYDIVLNDYGKLIKISSKASKKMFPKSVGGTNKIIDSNKIVASTNYDENKHEEITQSDCYIFIQTDKQIIVSIAPKKSSKIYFENTSSNTSFCIPNDSYMKYIISKEDGQFIEDDYISTNKDTNELIQVVNNFINNYNFE